MSDSLTPQVKDFFIDIHDKSMSDVHCPISLTMQTTFNKPALPSLKTRQGSKNSKKIKNYKSKWKEGVGPAFQQNFTNYDVEKLQENIANIHTSGADQVKINDLTNMLGDIFIKTAQKVGLYKEGEGKKGNI